MATPDDKLEPLRRQPTYRGGERQREIFTPGGIAPFPDLPARVRNLLVRSKYKSIAQVQNTPDDELLAVQGINERTLVVIRAFYPFSGELPPTMLCPCCRGVGRVPRYYESKRAAKTHGKMPSASRVRANRKEQENAPTAPELSRDAPDGPEPA